MAAFCAALIAVAVANFLQLLMFLSIRNKGTSPSCVHLCVIVYSFASILDIGECYHLPILIRSCLNTHARAHTHRDLSTCSEEIYRNGIMH